MSVIACDRCSHRVTKGGESLYNLDVLCEPCLLDEDTLPTAEAAKQANGEHTGDASWTGIGLTEEDADALALLREAREQQEQKIAKSASAALDADPEFDTDVAQAHPDDVPQVAPEKPKHQPKIKPPKKVTTVEDIKKMQANKPAPKTAAPKKEKQVAKEPAAPKEPKPKKEPSTAPRGTLPKQGEISFVERDGVKYRIAAQPAMPEFPEGAKLTPRQARVKAQASWDYERWAAYCINKAVKKAARLGK